MKSFAKALLVSSCAAARVGPNTRRPAAVNEAIGQRRFRANHRQVDAPGIDEPNHRVGVQDINRFSRERSGDTGIAGSAEHGLDAEFAGEARRHSVLARAAA
jgi:hypothetical protein